MRLLPLPLLLLPLLVSASPWRQDLVRWNLNANQNASSPLDYDASRQNTSYTPSPQNWRALPVYTILLDKFADGDPANNDFFGTPFESDYRETQLRYGGDPLGLIHRLDYLQAMGIRVILISGTPFLNMIWQADSQFSPSPSFPAYPSSRLLSPRFQRPRPPLGHHLRLALSHRRDPRTQHVLHGRLHRRHHVRSHRLQRVRLNPSSAP